MRKSVYKIINICLLALVMTALSFSALSLQHVQAAPYEALAKKKKKIVVDLSQQKLRAYEGDKVVFSFLVLTGRPELPTPIGTFKIMNKVSPTTFYSPWPYGSPYWYEPTAINYAMLFAEGGFFLHDSWWHTVYGPGTNKWHQDPVYGWQTGSHGCVSMSNENAARLYKWAKIGTKVVIKK